MRYLTDYTQDDHRIDSFDWRIIRSISFIDGRCPRAPVSTGTGSRSCCDDGPGPDEIV